MVCVTYYDSRRTKKINLFNQLFNTQLELVKDCFESKAIQNTLVEEHTIPLFVNSSKKYFVSLINPITKNFCEYYRANVYECKTRELSSYEITEI